MKKTLIVLAMVAAFGAHAQTTVDSTSGSNSNAGAASTSGVQSSNSGNTSVTAVGNQAGAQSGADSRSGAVSGSTSGAAGNIINLDQSVPSSQTINSTNTTRAEQILNGHTVEEVKQSGTVRQEVVYSGSQTVKNVPGIAMSGPASGPCTGVSGGLGLAGPGWGVGLNGSSVMVDCRLRENVRVIGMAVQSIDGGANPQERGEAMVMFMDALRGLSDYNKQLVADEVKPKKEAK